MPTQDGNFFARRSSTRYYTKEENIQLKADLELYRTLRVQEAAKSSKHPGVLLLDSSLITATKFKYGNIKIIQCGDYYEVYQYEEKKLFRDKTLIKNKEPLKNTLLYEKELDNLYLEKDDIKKSSSDIKEIEFKNILRSKLEMQRLVKSNENKFKTFITLTFEENITDIKEANKKFAIWRTKIQSIKKDFLYVCVPEFQKRGAVHYHLLTNLDIKENPELILTQKGKSNQYDVKYWKNGFSSVFSMKNINVIGYLSKYMTKDIDNRLFGHRRYFYSQNLKKPCMVYLDLNNINDFKKLNDILDHRKVYEKSYYTRFGEKLNLIEFKKDCEVD